MLRQLPTLRAEIATATQSITQCKDYRHRDITGVPTMLKILEREKNKTKREALHIVMQSEGFLEAFGNQTHRVRFEYPRIPCFFNVSRNDVLVRYGAPIVLTDRSKPDKPAPRNVRTTYLSLAGPSRHALNIALWRSNLLSTGFAQNSFPTVCALQDQRTLTEQKIVKLKTALKRVGFVYSEPFQGKPQQVIDAPDDEAPYTVTVLLRGVQVEGGAEDLIRARLESLCKDGFINYFGRRSTMAAGQGKNLLSGKWSKFFISELTSWNPFAAADAAIQISDYTRRRTLQTAQNLLQAIDEPFQGSAARKFLESLIETKGNTRKSLHHFPPAACQRYLRHVQRVVWNHFASTRVRKYGLRVQVGDMVVERSLQCEDTYLHDRTSFPRYMVKAVRTQEECTKYTLFDVVLPMPFNDGEINALHFPDLTGMTLEDYLRYTEQIGAKYFWDPPPVVRALLRSKPIELEYRCVFAKPLSLTHKIYFDPSRYEHTDRWPNDTQRLLANEFTLLPRKRSDGPFDDPMPGLCFDESLCPAKASAPFASLDGIESSKSKFFIGMEGKNVAHEGCPDSALFNDITLALDIKLPFDADFLSCLRETFAFEPLCSENHRKWMGRLHISYTKLADREGAAENTEKADEKGTGDDGEKHNTTEEFASTWSCELCGTLNDEAAPVCEVCNTSR